MSIKIYNYEFEGPYDSTSNLADESGIYAILCKNGNNTFSLVDVGESSTVKTRIDNHDRKVCWLSKCSISNWKYAVYYTPHLQQSGRKEIEQFIRAKYPSLCGDR